MARRKRTSQSSVICFGVGDGWPCRDRNHASFLYRFGTTSVLIDCGEPVDRCLKASGLGYDAMDGIFLSHLHADHFGGLFMLLQGCWLEKRRKDLPVFLPTSAVKPLRRMLDSALLFDELFQFRLQLEPLKAGRPEQAGGVTVTPFGTTHLDGIRASLKKKPGGLFAAYCFLLESKTVRVGHSADLGQPEDLAPLLEEPLDLLVCELAHFKPEDLFRYLQGRAIRRVVFVHLARLHWEKLPQIRRLAAKMLPDIPHTFGRDNQEILL